MTGSVTDEELIKACREVWARIGGATTLMPAVPLDLPQDDRPAYLDTLLAIKSPSDLPLEERRAYVDKLRRCKGVDWRRSALKSTQ
jgi:hypothetical protein